MKLKRNHKIYIAIAGVVFLVVFLPWIVGGLYKRQPPPSAPAQQQTQTIQASSGNGTTATYEVNNNVGMNMFSVTPHASWPGKRVTLAWSVADAESNSVTIEGVDGVFATQGALPVYAPNVEAPAHSFTYRLEAKRKGGGEPIKMLATLEIVPKK